MKSWYAIKQLHKTTLKQLMTLFFVDQFIYLGSSISSTEHDVNIWIVVEYAEEVPML